MTVLSTGHDIEILITETEIAARTTQLARMIKEQYRDTEQLVVVGLLRGSFVFIADLVRRLDLPVEVDFMTVSSYGDKMESSRQVRIIQDLETPIKGRDVLIVEDIIDTGHTLSQVYDILETREPRSLRVCALLNKPSRREVDVEIDWVGFEIPDEFVIGYGIDFRAAGTQPAAYRRGRQEIAPRPEKTPAQNTPARQQAWLRPAARPHSDRSTASRSLSR